MKNKHPKVFIIAGPNGAGKTTFALKFLKEIATVQFVNADLIASGVSPLAPETVSTQAGRVFLNRVQGLAEKGNNFAFETTLSGRSYLKLFKRLKELGYKLHLFFLWVPSIELSLKRIAERVKKGGHNVPEPVVRRRFTKGIYNLFKFYKPLFDLVVFFDNSGEHPHLISVMEGQKVTVVDKTIYERILKMRG